MNPCTCGPYTQHCSLKTNENVSFNVPPLLKNFRQNFAIGKKLMISDLHPHVNDNILWCALNLAMCISTLITTISKGIPIVIFSAATCYHSYRLLLQHAKLFWKSLVGFFEFYRLILLMYMNPIILKSNSKKTINISGIKIGNERLFFNHLDCLFWIACQKLENQLKYMAFSRMSTLSQK